MSILGECVRVCVGFERRKKLKMILLYMSIHLDRERTAARITLHYTSWSIAEKPNISIINLIWNTD